MIYLVAACICASPLSLFIEGVRLERKVQKLRDRLSRCPNCPEE